MSLVSTSVTDSTTNADKPLCSIDMEQTVKLFDDANMAPVYNDTTFIVDNRANVPTTADAETNKMAVDSIPLVTTRTLPSTQQSSSQRSSGSSSFFASVSASFANSKGLIMSKSLLSNHRTKANNTKVYNSSGYAATVNNVVFSYGRGKKAANALDDITLKVPVGNIYGILGPSGCGKSTLVHCLVGSLKPKSGCVKVFGEVPGSHKSLVPGPGVGYMPQEIGLFNEFTIKETLFFFGRLYRLPIQMIRTRTEFLITFLELPDKSSLVGKLSGGQKRRVSLAAALVHNPPLLVLDEPTVGIDPVLRQSIWRHLRSLTHDDGITVIITTHYIDEAQYANTVAFMRNGCLLLQGNPLSLIRRFQLKNLEEVFLALCNNSTQNEPDLYKTDSEKPLLISEKTNDAADSCDKNDESDEETVAEHGTRPDSINNFSRQSYPDATTPTNLKKKGNDLAERLLSKRNKLLDHFARTSALLAKNAIRMRRNLPVLFFSAFIPAVQCFLFFYCLGRDPANIPVSVYNGEQPPNYSQYFLNSIDNHSIQQFSVSNLEQGYESVKNGNAKGFLVIPSNYSNSLIEKMSDLIEADNETIRSSFIDLYLDMSSQFHANKIREKVFDAYFKSVKKLLIENNLNPTLANSPINIAKPILGVENPSVTDFMVPGFIMSLSFFSSIATAALTLVLERKDGLLERSMVSGVYPNEYILSHVITQTVVVIFQTMAVLMISFFVFQLPYSGPVFWISVLIVMQGVCGMAYGILISAIAKEENFTLAACMGSMFPQFLLSGVVWPIETMPKVLMYISTFFSQAKSIEAVRYMLYRNWDPLHHWDVLLGFIITASWTFTFLFVAAILFNVNKS